MESIKNMNENLLRLITDIELVTKREFNGETIEDGMDFIRKYYREYERAFS